MRIMLIAVNQNSDAVFLTEPQNAVCLGQILVAQHPAQPFGSARLAQFFFRGVKHAVKGAEFFKQ